MACDQSYFRRLTQKQGHALDQLYDWPLAANHGQVTNSKPFSLINLGPFRAKPFAEREKPKPFI